MQLSLHIVSFDIPFPANYGGVIVVFNNIKALYKSGVEIYLHCFEYGNRKPQIELDQYCKKVFYYPRKRSLQYMIGELPFITQSRKDKNLVKRLIDIDAPILYEGLHCCAEIGHPQLSGRMKLVRMHNIEWEYYQNLADLEDNFFKKYFFSRESKKIRAYEAKAISKANKILAISPTDFRYFNSKFPNCHYIPAFHPNKEVQIKLGNGKYALFHGKLSVKDNEAAALFLIKTIFANLDFHLIIAGLEPTQQLRSLVNEYDHVKLQENLSDQAMVQLIQNAQVNILWSFQNAGIKLKLLHALFNGRFCIANDFICKDTGLESLCILANDPDDLKNKIINTFEQSFAIEEVNRRKSILGLDFSNLVNAQKTIDLLVQDTV